MKSNIAIKPILKPIFASALLCGALLHPAFADPVPDATTTAPTTSAHHYMFKSSQIDSHVTVRLYDEANEDFNPVIIEIVADAGGRTRLERADIIADRMQRVCEADPTFANDLKFQTLNHITTVIAQTQDGNLVVTADDHSKRTLCAATCEVYAQRIIDGIQDRLKGVKFRDAPFDYTLTGDQKAKRASEYYKEALDALDPKDKDTDVAVSKYKLAIGLSDNNYYRLQLAQLYTELNQKEAARALYQHVQSATEADPDDKKVASDALQGINTGKG